MKKTYLKVLSVAAITSMLASAAAPVFAANGDFQDLTNGKNYLKADYTKDAAEFNELILALADHGSQMTFENGGQDYYYQGMLDEITAEMAAGKSIGDAFADAKADPKNVYHSAASITKVSAVNGTITVTMDKDVTGATAADFAVTQKIDSAAATTVTPTVTVNGAVVTLAVTPVVATTADQSVVYSVSYKSGTAVAADAVKVAAIPDTTAPVITLTGSATVNVANGATYTDAGATAKDDRDATVTVTSVIKNSAGTVVSAIDTTVADTYTITYSAVDAAGNAAIAVTRTVIVAQASLAAKSVSALNLKQVQVVFNQAVDKTTAETVGNYNVAGFNPATATLQSDNKTVLLVLAVGHELANQSTNNTVVVSGVKDTSTPAKIMLTQTFTNIAITDNTLPTVVSAAMTDPTHLQVIFSEPVKLPAAEASTTAASNIFSVDGGVYTTTGNPVVDHSKNALTFALSSALPAGQHTVRVLSGQLVDYAAFQVLQTDLSFNYTAVTAAPTVSVTKATPTSITIKFSTTVSNVAAATIYAGYTTVTPSSVTNPSADNQTYVLTYATPILGSSVNLVINNNSSTPIVDGWNNKFVNTTIPITLTVDSTKPTLVSTTATSSTTAKLVFSKNLRNDSPSVTGSATNPSNYTLQDANGNVITSSTSGFAGIVDAAGHPLSNPIYTDATMSVVVTFGGALPTGSYKIQVANIQDQTSYNYNTMDSATGSITLTNNFAISSAVSNGANTTILVFFNRSMATSGNGSILTAANYKLDVNGDGILEDLPVGTAITAQGTNGALLTFPSSPGTLNGTVLYTPGVTDASGNSLGITGVSKTIASDVAVAIADIQKIKLVNSNTVTFEVKKPLSGTLVASNFKINGAAVATASYANQVLSDGTTYGAVVTLNTTAGLLATNVAANQLALAAAPDTGVTLATLVNAFTTVAGTQSAAINDLYNAGGNVVTDNAPAKIIVRETMDANADGKIDGAEIVFSEPVKMADLNVNSITVAGYTVTGITPITTGNRPIEATAVRTLSTNGTVTATDTFVVTFTQNTTADTGAVPAILLTNTVRDGAAVANVMAAEVSATNATDKAPEVINSATLYDGTTNIAKTAGTAAVAADYILVKFDEAITTGDVDLTAGAASGTNADFVIQRGVAAAGDTALNAGTTITASVVDSKTVKITFVAVNAADTSIANAGSVAAISDDTLKLLVNSIKDSAGNNNAVQTVTIK